MLKIMPRTLDTALIGCGIAGRNIHLPILKSHSEINLRAVCDVDYENLESIATSLNISAYRDVDEMLKKETLDSVHICTPPSTHVPIAKKMLREGIPVLIEKPVAPSTEAVEELRQVSAETNTMASVVHNKLFKKHVQRALRSVRCGEYGDVVSVTMLHSEPRDVSTTERGNWVFDLPGGEVGEGIPHQAYLPLAFVGGLGDIVSVSKQNFSGHEEVGFDGVALEAVDRTGKSLITIKTIMNTVPKDQLYVECTKGELLIDTYKNGTFRNTIGTGSMPEVSLRDVLLIGSLSLAGQLTYNIFRQVVDKIVRIGFEALNNERAMANDSHYEQISAHISSIKTNSEPPVTLDEAEDTIRVLEALENS